jgi:pyridoxine kinase
MDLFEGLQLSGLDNFQYLLTGYIPDAATATMVGKIAETLKQKDPELIWGIHSSYTPCLIVVLDPVLGDDGVLYVAEELVSTYKAIIPQADIILPNHYEAEWLVGVKISKLEDIVPCIEALHRQYRVRNIVISSIRLETHPGVILCCGSTSTSDFKPRAFIIEAPIIDGPFVGTGDLFAALVVARLHPFIRDLVPDDSVPTTDLVMKKVLEGVIASMQGVLQKTKKAMDVQTQLDGDLSTLDSKKRLVKVMRAAELRLVASQDALLHPRIQLLGNPL